MPCPKCRRNEITHILHSDGCTQEMCCQCYVASGHAPDKDHEECLKAAKELKKAHKC